ncbi:hypothetical protein FISHEDRAFT_56496 [Fistulina hepatica ATCC 64428]|uniref:Uncharacterized protein n=1 Tax=Fistulina hepatica ATCC 64428 TaxID=1128425 RepID=A0A0D7AJU2_9AGAR|nr:hypothetical protein FISHEDRAFT_56496 [Fistulina hepatica ATCC 64428]
MPAIVNDNSRPNSPEHDNSQGDSTQRDSSQTLPRGPLNHPAVDDAFQAKYIRPPPKIACTEAPLNAHLIYNRQSDTFNTFQVDASLFYAASADVDPQAEPGEPQRPLYEFSPAEIRTFATDADFRKKYEDYLEERDLGSKLPDDLILAINDFHERQLDATGTRQPLGPSNASNAPSASMAASGTAGGRSKQVSYLGFIKENTRVFTEIDYLGAKAKIVFPEEYQAAVINGHHLSLRLLLSDVIRSFMENPEITFPIWFSLEREFAELVRTSHAFSAPLWKQELSSTLRLAKLSGLSLTSSVANAFAAKRPAGPSSDERTTKIAKLAPRTFQTPVQSFRRPTAPTNGNFPSRAVCFVCKGDHKYSEHPRDQTRDANGKTYYAVISNDGILLRASDSREFCISFNIKGTCAHRHGCERLDICCSCGSDKHGLLGPGGCGSKHGN